MAFDANQNLVVEVIGELNKVLQEAQDSPAEKESSGRFISYLQQLRSHLDQLNGGKTPELPLRVKTALSGVKAELVRFQDPLQVWKNKSRLYLLTHCREVVSEFQKTTHGIGSCLVRFPVSKTACITRYESQMKDVSKKVEGLAREMQQAQFTVSASEEHICLTLEKEASQVEKKEDSDSGFQNAILLDIGREIGLDLDRNRGALFEQLQLLRKELGDCQDQRQIQFLETIELLFQSWSREPAVPRWHALVEAAEDEPVLPLETFLCPLTKQVMKDPVFLQSNHTYERRAIENWFSSCQQRGCQPTCPVSGQVLTSTDMQPSLVLRQTIHDWEQRNTGVRIRQAKLHLSPTASDELAEPALKETILIAEDSDENRRMIYEAGIIPLVLGFWRRNLRGRPHLRTLAISALSKIAIGSQESKDTMVEMGVLKLAVQSLGSCVDKEKESAIGLLYELSLSPSLRARIGEEKGAIVALVGITSTHSSENIESSNRAEQILLHLEDTDFNVLQMAEAGRMKPVLTRLHQGSEETQVNLAKQLSKLFLTNTDREYVAEAGGKTLVQMLSVSLSASARDVTLGAIFNLSALDGSADALMKSGVIPHLVSTIASSETHMNLQEIALCTLANLVLVNGTWEDCKVDEDGHFLHSDETVLKFFGLMQSGSSKWKEKILLTLYRIATSPRVADAVAATACSCGGLTTLMTLMEDSNTNIRLNALRLLSVLSVHVGDDIATALRSTLQLKYLKEVLQQHGKTMLEDRVAAATILANVPLTEFETIRVLEVEILEWTVAAIQESKTGRLGRQSGRTDPAMQEALMGILLHFARNSNVKILNTMRHLHLFTIFKEKVMEHTWTPLIKERAALGLQHLSQRAHLFTLRESPPQASRRRPILGLCMFPSKTIRDLPEKCDVHGGLCDPNRAFCLVTARVIAPLIELLEEEDNAIREAVLGALSTLLMDGVNAKAGVEELIRAEGVQPVINLFYSVREGSLQERTVWIIERILRVEQYAQGYAADQGLVKVLMDAMMQGHPKTSLLAQQALVSLNQISAGESSSPRKSHQKPRNST